MTKTLTMMADTMMKMSIALRTTDVGPMKRSVRSATDALAVAKTKTIGHWEIYDHSAASKICEGVR